MGGTLTIPLLPPILIKQTIGITVKSRFNESRFNVKSRFKVQNLVTKIEFHIKKSRDLE